LQEPDGPTEPDEEPLEDFGTDEPSDEANQPPEDAWTPVCEDDSAILPEDEVHCDQRAETQRFRVPVEGATELVDRVEIESSFQAATPIEANATTGPIDGHQRYLPAGFQIPALWFRLASTSDTALDVHRTGFHVTVDQRHLRGHSPIQGLVLQAQNGSWHPVDTQVHEQGDASVTYEVQADQLGSFAFALDHAGPTVQLVQPSPGASVESVSQIRVAWDDNRGLDRGNATLSVDGQPASLTPNETAGEANIDELEPGSHNVTIRLSDVSGHTVEETWTVHVQEADERVVDPGREVPTPGLGVLGLAVAMAALALPRRGDGDEENQSARSSPHRPP
jgi:hypothetical protein